MSIERVERVPLDRILADQDQPRQEVDEVELGLLRSSMGALGRTVQLITVAPQDDGTWRLLSGERRVRAARELGWSWLPAIVVDDGADPPTRFARQVAENAARANLRPWELCQAIDRMRASAGPTELAAAAGISVRTVHNYLAILEHPDLVERLRAGGSLRSILAEVARRRQGDPESAEPTPLHAARRATTALVTVWEGLAPEEQAELATVLRRLIDSATGSHHREPT